MEDENTTNEDNEDVADDEVGDLVLAANEEGTEQNSSTAVVIGNELVDAAAQSELGSRFTRSRHSTRDTLSCRAVHVLWPSHQ